jgi:hypothetical protein
MSDRWIPEAGDWVTISSRPGWTGRVRRVIRGDVLTIILVPRPPEQLIPYAVQEKEFPLADLAPYA